MGTVVNRQPEDLIGHIGTYSPFSPRPWNYSLQYIIQGQKSTWYLKKYASITATELELSVTLPWRISSEARYSSFNTVKSLERAKSPEFSYNMTSFNTQKATIQQAALPKGINSSESYGKEGWQTSQRAWDNGTCQLLVEGTKTRKEINEAQEHLRPK